MGNRLSHAAGRRIARSLQRPMRGYTPFNLTPPAELRHVMRPGDVLLVEGGDRVSGVIKTLTHSTWSHAAFFTGGPEGAELIEADLTEGVRRASLDLYAHLNTRICRPVQLSAPDLAHVTAYLTASLGRHYDLRNIFDLIRYLLPMPPLPPHLGRRALALGSGDPTRAICSTLIAEAFQSVRYPILPEIRHLGRPKAAHEVLHIRHHSLFTPRDFDLSPYFEVVKPRLAKGFDYRAVEWENAPARDA